MLTTRIQKREAAVSLVMQERSVGSVTVDDTPRWMSNLYDARSLSRVHFYVEPFTNPVVVINTKKDDTGMVANNILFLSDFVLEGSSLLNYSLTFETYAYIEETAISRLRDSSLISCERLK